MTPLAIVPWEMQEKTEMHVSRFAFCTRMTLAADAGYHELITNNENNARFPFVLTDFTEPRTKRRRVLSGIWMPSGKYKHKATVEGGGSEFKVTVTWNKGKFNADYIMQFLAEPKDKNEKAVYYHRMTAMEEAFNSLMAHSDSEIKSVMRIPLPDGVQVQDKFDINKGIVGGDGSRFLLLEASEPMNDFEQQNQDDDYEATGE